MRLFFFFLHRVYFRGERVGLRVATTPWDSRVNPYIRLNPSPRNFRRGWAVRVRMCGCLVRFSFFLFQRHPRVPPVDFSLQGPPLCSRKRDLSCCRFSLPRKCRGSWMCRVVRCLFIWSKCCENMRTSGPQKIRNLNFI